MIEFIVWQVRLWLVDYRDRVAYREQGITLNLSNMFWLWPWRWTRDMVDRLSPFDPYAGYSRRPLRRFLWIVFHPLRWQRLTSLRLVIRILNRVDGGTPRGRYEGNSSSRALIAAWLDEHSEYASRSTGSVDWGVALDLFENLDAPWSRKPESWLLSHDHHGFVTADQFYYAASAIEVFEATDRDYVNDEENVDEYGGPDDSAPWTNREGQPEFNGAFR